MRSIRMRFQLQSGSETKESSSPSEVAISSVIHTETENDAPATATAREGWSTPLTLYENCWLRPHALGGSTTILRDKFVPRPDDVILAVHPKCGTTWLKTLAFTIVNRSRYPLAGGGGEQHPLRTTRPHVAVPFITMRPELLDRVAALPSPRLLSTHLPLPLLPPSVAASGCRIVCLVRDPKDAFVSRWHFEKKIAQGITMGIEDAFAMFRDGCSSYGPFFDRYLEYWNESLARPAEVMFLRYEEMAAAPLEVVRRLASFLRVPFSQEEESSGVAEQVVSFCSFESLRGLDANKPGRVFLDGDGGKVAADPSSLFREGKVGDWVNHLSKEMAEEMDRLVADKFDGSGLVF